MAAILRAMVTLANSGHSAERVYIVIRRCLARECELHSPLGGEVEADGRATSAVGAKASVGAAQRGKSPRPAAPVLAPGRLGYRRLSERRCRRATTSEPSAMRELSLALISATKPLKCLRSFMQSVISFPRRRPLCSSGPPTRGSFVSAPRCRGSRNLCGPSTAQMPSLRSLTILLLHDSPASC